MNDDVADDDFSFEDSDDLIEEFDDDTDYRLCMESDLADICNTYVKFSDLNIKSLLQFESRPIVLLTEEEREVINNCRDEKLTRLLILNRSHYSQVRELTKQLQNVLMLCNKYIAKGKETVEEFKMTRQLTPYSVIRSDIWRTAAPYFKDAQYYGAPVNSDVIKKQKNGELCQLVINEGRRWSVADKRALIKNIKSQYFEHCYNNLKKKLIIKKSELKSIMENQKKVIEEDINHINKEINELKPCFPPLNVIDGVDWHSISSVALKGRHPVVECIGFWNMILHPDLNTSKWTLKEEEKLQEIVEEHATQDWDTIVKELNTGRSPFAVAKHYFTNFALKYNKHRFTPEEDEYIVEVVENVRLGSYIPWGKVSYYFDNRSKYQLYHRYKYYLSYNNIRKGQFSEAEDAMLIYLVEKFGKHFSKVVSYFPNRTPVQLRNRYGNYLDKSEIRVGTYTHDDDLKILEHVRDYGDKNWCRAAASLKRTRAHVRQRYLSLRRWIDKHPNSDISKMPRRNSNAVTKNYSKRNKRISEILEHINASVDIPKLETLEGTSSSKKDNHTIKHTYKQVISGVDKDLVDFFKGTYRYQRAFVRNSDGTLLESARRIVQLMGVFEEDLNIFKHSIEDDISLNVTMSNILPYIKQILESEGETLSANPTNLSISHDPNSLGNDGKNLKYLIPPTIRSLIGLRGLIIKFNMYKHEHNLHKGGKVNFSNALSLKLEQVLLKCNAHTQSVLLHHRNLFYNRLYSLFKWPIMLSYQFPTHIKFSESKPEPSSGIPPVINTNSNVLMVEKESGKKIRDIALNQNLNSDELTVKHSHIQSKSSRPRKFSAKVIQIKNVSKVDKTSIKNTRKDESSNFESQPSTSAYITDTTSVNVTEPMSINSDLRLDEVIKSELVDSADCFGKDNDCHELSLNGWLSFDDDLDTYNGIEVSNEIDDKVMRDLAIYKSIMQQPMDQS